MAVPLLSLVPKIFRTVGGILGLNSITDIVDAVSNNRLTPEQRVALDVALKEHEKEMRALDIEELKTVLSETNLMIASGDKYVARARPTGLYVAYVISIALTAALVYGTKIDAAAILTICAPLYGAQGYYMHLRTREKLNGNSAE